MSKKTTTETREVISYFCDFCKGSKLVNSNHSCLMCKKHTCGEHTVFDEGDGGDYPSRYCISCWEVGAPFREQCEIIEREAEEKCDELMKQWYLNIKNY